MIGQEKLISKINSYTLSTLPHSILLLGERGSGQRELCEMISSRLSLDLFDLTKIDNFKEFIDVISLSSTPTLYTIDLLEFNDPKDIKQNSMLKLFEEPGPFTYIIIYGDNDSHILDTIKNRSYILNMEKYSRDQLEPLVTGDKELILSICNTPGQIEIANHSNIKDMFSLVTNIIDNISKANFSNTLSIANKINFKDEYDKYDLFLFIKCFGISLVNRIPENIKLYSSMYDTLRSMNNKVWLVSNKRQQFENFLIKLWELSRSSSLQQTIKEV